MITISINEKKALNPFIDFSSTASTAMENMRKHEETVCELSMKIDTLDNVSYETVKEVLTDEPRYVVYSVFEGYRYEKENPVREILIRILDELDGRR